ncbi:hypothetical protein [Xenophilus sp. Marseille-Q4582]|uniref:hypothetical protein n=1 Tax=Xenophilus sp. Marseille-Q4582 TaxID=2866600 RepID=UPI001CE3EB2A|nr:hypothetical protein [Xenophilus sp. Marseille-Q4582]
MTKKKFTRTTIAQVVEKVQHRTSAFCAVDQFAKLNQRVKKAAGAAVDLVLKNPCLCGAVPPRRKGNSEPEKCGPSLKLSHQVIAEAHALSPTFFDSTMRTTLPQRSRSEKQWARQVGERMDLAEVILICCAAMCYPAKKPTAQLWALMEMCWHRWDELDTLDELIRRKRSDHCRLGGIKRHDKHAAIMEQAIPLLTSAAPTQGWMSKAHAGDVVGELLIQIAQEAEYKGSLELDQWSRTIQQFIREDPRAKAAFEKKRSARRCHRVSGTRAQRPCRVRRKA